MLEILHREFVYLYYYFSVQLEQIALYWALGIVIGSCVSVFFKKKMQALLDGMKERKLGIFGIIPAALLGIASPLCMYGTVPIAASLAIGGMREDWLAAFMMSSILLNPQLLIYSAALGPRIFILRFAFCLLGGIVAGLCVRFFFRNQSFFSFTKLDASGDRDTHPNLFMRLLLNMWRNLKVTGPYFLLGIAITAIYQRYVPQEVVATVFGKTSRGFGVLLATTLGVPVYVCGGGTIPLLQEWLWNGMSAGSAVAFMISGPATKFTNLGAVKIILGKKNFILYIAFAILFAFLSGTLVDLVI